MEAKNVHQRIPKLKCQWDPPTLYLALSIALSENLYVGMAPMCYLKAMMSHELKHHGKYQRSLTKLYGVKKRE